MRDMAAARVMVNAPKVMAAARAMVVKVKVMGAAQKAMEGTVMVAGQVTIRVMVETTLLVLNDSTFAMTMTNTGKESITITIMGTTRMIES